MFLTISEETKKILWKHQVDALDFAIKHLNNNDTPCLIRMPTGTGKTGVIACLTRISNTGSSLVLTPWANLRNQMVSDIKNNFWEKIGLQPKVIEVVSIFPKTAKEILEINKPQIIVTTFTSLNDLRINSIELYKSLAETISLVIVDEGHYEPAVEWGKSVKGLKTKTVILTATPYRNDLKLFRISDPEKSTYHFTHKQALEQKIIRALAIEDLDSHTDIRSLTQEFMEKWITAKSNHSLASPNPRAIICCSSANEIELVVNFLINNGIKAIGLHENFANSTNDFLLKVVPDSKLNNSEIWVHQFKLSEGLDDNRFCCVALFTRIRNDRKLIQQIGRVLRHDSNDFENPAILFAPKKFSVISEWNAYLEFETDLRLLDPQHFRTIVDKLLELQPKAEYFEGRFRRKFDPTKLPDNPQVLISPSVKVRFVKDDFSLSDYVEDCTDTLNTNDAVILGPDINGPCQKTENYALWVYSSVRNSRFLNNSLYEISLETHCVVISDGFLFISDSRGIFPEDYLEDHSSVVPKEVLAHYFDKRFRPTNVSINSSIPYDTVHRGANFRGHNLLKIPASLTDRVQILQSIRGSSKNDGRRYIGMSNGRIRSEVSDELRRSFDLSTFVSWTEGVAKILNSDIESNTLINRYMPTCIPPDPVIPRTICVDFLQANLSLETRNSQECRLMSSAFDFHESDGNKPNKYVFSFMLAGEDFENAEISLEVEYQPEKRRFWFNKLEGESVQVNIENEGESKTKNLVEFLNFRQDIILIGLEGGEIVYHDRNFYKIDYEYAERELLSIIERPSTGQMCNTEKGSKKEIDQMRQSKSTTFPEGSLFRAITDRQFPLPFVDDTLICDDMGTEVADFIAANFDKHQLALIHAKAGGGKNISASAFHDVVAQAMKNLVYLTRNSEVPDKVRSWGKSAKWNKTNVPRIYRLPIGFPTGESLWKKIKSDIIESSNPELYVILVTTGCSDRDLLQEVVHDQSKRTPEIAQIFHIFDGLNGYARQLGVRLVIYDIPYQTT